MDITERIRDFVSPHLARLAEIDIIAEADPEQGLDHLAKFIASLIREGATTDELREILARLDRIEQTLKEIKMSQSDIDSAVATDTALLSDLTAQTAAISAAQTALAAEIASLQGAGVDTSGLDAINAQLAAAQAPLDAAVAALTASSQPAPPADGTDGSVTPGA